MSAIGKIAWYDRSPEGYTFELLKAHGLHRLYSFAVPTLPFEADGYGSEVRYFLAQAAADGNNSLEAGDMVRCSSSSADESGMLALYRGLTSGLLS